MQIGWTLNFLVSLTGISLGITAILLAVNLERVQKQSIVRYWIAISIIVSVLLQIISWLIPFIAISSYWFVIAVLPFINMSADAGARLVHSIDAARPMPPDAPVINNEIPVLMD